MQIALTGEDEVEGLYLPLALRFPGDFTLRIPAQSTGGDGGSSGGSQVSLRVADPKGSTYLSKKNYAYQSGMTVLSLLQQTNLEIGVRSGDYVYAIAGLREFQEGPLSGWLFRVNGEFVSTSSAQTSLEPGDYVEWLYTRDGGADIGSDQPMDLGGGAALDEEEKEQLENALAQALKALSAEKGQDAGFWQAFALARSGENLSAEVLKNLQDSVKAHIKVFGGQYDKATDIAAAIFAVRALGLDAFQIEGENLAAALVSFPNPANQGVNGYIYTLLAYDALGLRLPDTAVNSRQALKSGILNYQNADGGFSLSKGADSDVDITAAALQALAPYKEEAAIKTAVNKALTFLKGAQKNYGGFASMNIENCESAAQVILALIALDIDPTGGEFVKNNRSVLDALYAYQLKDGGFAHIEGGKADAMATQQGAQALIAFSRWTEGGKGLFQMDAPVFGAFQDAKAISTWAAGSVAACRQYGLMSGDDAGRFNPSAALTRGEAAAMLSRLFYLTAAADAGAFQDVPANAWYAPYIAGVQQQGLMMGASGNLFNPKEPITRQDFAVILTRAFSLTAPEGAGIAKDFQAVSPYAKQGVQAVSHAGLMVGGESGFMPQAPVNREMAAAIFARVYENYFE